MVVEFEEQKKIEDITVLALLQIWQKFEYEFIDMFTFARGWSLVRNGRKDTDH